MGRVVRGKDGRVARVVEDADATEAERDIDEVATSIYCFRRGLLAPALRRISPDNAKGEYYLTDVVAVLHGTGHKVVALVADDPSEAVGVNDRAQLAEAEAELRRRINERWMRAGVTMVDPGHTYVDAAVHLAADVTLLPGTVLQGRTVVRPGGPPRARTPAWPTAWWARGPRWSRRSATTPRSGRRASSGPFATPRRRGPYSPGSHHRRLLHCPGRR